MRILIADHQRKVRFALRVALEQLPGSRTIAEAMDAQDVAEQTRELCPNLALVAWELPGLPMAELISALHHNCRSARVIVLSSRAETREQALAAGADAFVCMCDAPDELLSAIARCLDATEPLDARKG